MIQSSLGDEPEAGNAVPALKDRAKLIRSLRDDSGGAAGRC